MQVPNAHLAKQFPFPFIPTFTLALAVKPFEVKYLIVLAFALLLGTEEIAGYKIKYVNRFRSQMLLNLNFEYY
jgi:hypothetical protein